MKLYDRHDSILKEKIVGDNKQQQQRIVIVHGRWHKMLMEELVNEARRQFESRGVVFEEIPVREGFDLVAAARNVACRSNVYRVSITNVKLFPNAEPNAKFLGARVCLAVPARWVWRSRNGPRGLP